jgi:hypothetical protein
VIENDDRHFQQISEALKGEGYDVVQMKSGRPAVLYNYKALHGENQIVIVDYNLGRTVDSREGRELMRSTLWEVDRAAIFIAFSRYVHEKDKGDPPDLRSLQPYRVLVPKDVDGQNRITTGSLSELVAVVKKCREIAIPVLEHPRHETYRMAAELEDYLTRSTLGATEYPPVVKQRILDSETVLEKLSAAAVHIARGGRRTTRLGIGVYGSCGRLEKRTTSDVEFSVFYDESPGTGEARPDPEVLKLGVTCWNRIAYFCRHNGWDFELQEKIDRKPGYLQVRDAGNQLENRYLPVISVGTLLSADLQLQAGVRNRYFQVLTELRPIFNPALFFRLKQQMITDRERIAANLSAVAGSAHLRNIMEQFTMDTEPELITSWKQLKRFYSRFMNILACRLALVRDLRYRPRELNSDARWQALFDSLTEPGIMKVARFANTVHADSKIKPAARKKLSTATDKAMGKYFDLLARYSRLPDDSDAKNNPAVSAEIADLRGVARQLAGHCIDVLEVVAAEAPFDEPLSTARWLVDTGKFRATADRL